MTETTVTLWQDSEPADTGPDLELAVYLLAAGAAPAVIRRRCRFPTLRAVQAFNREDSTREAVEALTHDRAKRVGKQALVVLEKLLRRDHTDLRATVLAVRTGLEVSGDLKRDHAAPVKSVRELTVPELNQLIEQTKRELEARSG